MLPITLPMPHCSPSSSPFSSLTQSLLVTYLFNIYYLSSRGINNLLLYPRSLAPSLRALFLYIPRFLYPLLNTVLSLWVSKNAPLDLIARAESNGKESLLSLDLAYPSSPASRKIDVRTSLRGVNRMAGRWSKTSKSPKAGDPKATLADKTPPPARQAKVPRGLRGPREEKLFASTGSIIVNLPRSNAVSFFVHCFL